MVDVRNQNDGDSRFMEIAACVGRNNQRALRRLIPKQPVQCATLIAPTFAVLVQPRHHEKPMHGGWGLDSRLVVVQWVGESMPDRAHGRI